MRPNPSLFRLIAALALLGAVAACAPHGTGATFSPRALGAAAHVSYGTIVASRPVQVAGGDTRIGTLGGAAAGGIAGSYIGGDWRSNLLAGIGGAILGGLAGGAIERGVTAGTATEFIIRDDRGADIAVVQTNEEGLQVGDRVMVTRGDRVRLSRAAGNAPAPGAAVPGVFPTGAGERK